MTSFSVSGTVVPFVAVEAFMNKAGPLEEWTFGILVNNATDWGALFSLRSWMVTQRPIPGGTTVFVDVGGGAGPGSLIVDSLDAHTAILTSLDRSDIEPGTLRSRGKATFLIV